MKRLAGRPKRWYSRLVLFVLLLVLDMCAFLHVRPALPLQMFLAGLSSTVWVLMLTSNGTVHLVFLLLGGEVRRLANLPIN